MKLIDWVLLIIATFLALSFIYGIRKYVREGHPPSIVTVNATMLWSIAIMIKIIFKFTSLHFLWIFPISLILGFLSRKSFLSNFGWLFGRLCCIGLDEEQIRKNSEREKFFQELLKLGKTPDEARQIVIEEETTSGK